MTAGHGVRWATALVLVASAWVGCGHRDGDGHDHGKEETHVDGKSHGHDHGHGHDEETPSGASFKAGKGVILTEETRRILGVEEVEVAERPVPIQIDLTMQVFGENHRHGLNETDHIGCDVQGSGFLAADTASVVKAGQSVQVFKSTNGPLQGVVLSVGRVLALGDSEIVIGVSNATASLTSGEFIPVRINLIRDGAVMAIPQAALLRTSEGTFVYTVNGDAYFRTAVKLGAEADGWVEIVDGLLAGDRVLTRPVQTLWLIELRATKGGGHSH